MVNTSTYVKLQYGYIPARDRIVDFGVEPAVEHIENRKMKFVTNYGKNRAVESVMKILGHAHCGVVRHAMKRVSVRS